MMAAEDSLGADFGGEMLDEDRSALRQVVRAAGRCSQEDC